MTNPTATERFDDPEELDDPALDLAGRRVLVTGGAGFLGSFVTEALRRRGAEHVFVPRSAEFDLTRRQQVERLFEVRVKDVRTMVVRGKNKRFGRHYGKRPNWKKALVTLNGDDAINVYGGAV